MPNHEVQNPFRPVPSARSVVSEGDVATISAFGASGRSAIFNPEPSFSTQDFLEEYFALNNNNNAEPTNDLDCDDCEDDDSDMENEYYNPYDSDNEGSNPSSKYNLVINLLHKLDLLNVTMPRYSRDDYHQMRNSYNAQVQHRRNWIFERIEREGFERRRLDKFSLEDLLDKLEKKNHILNTDTSKFYDWKLGGTEYIIRLEHIAKDGCDILICHYIHTPTNKLFRKDTRFWNGSRFELIEEYASNCD